MLKLTVKGTTTTVQELISEPDRGETALQKTSGELKMYHGTSMVRWAEIKKHGLKPNKAPKDYYDLVKGYSEHNIYLTFDERTAHNYASRAAIEDRSTAAVLEVTVRDFTKFTPDEDSLYWLDQTKYGKEWIKKHGKTTHFRHNEWKTDPELMKIYMAELPRSLRQGSVAYKGQILPKDIRLIRTFKPVKMPENPDEEEFNAAMDKTHASINNSPEAPRQRKPKRDTPVFGHVSTTH